MDKTSYDFLKILTVNCQGLGDYKKRSDVLNYLKDKNYNIYFLQDTHFTSDEEQNIQLFWDGKTYFSSFRSNSRGVAILFKNNFDFKVKNTTCDANGNFLIVEVEIENKDFLLVNVYGPNTDQPGFYSNLRNEIEKLYINQHIILAGDFNVVLNQELDTMNYKKLNNPKNQCELNKIIDILDLEDSFRISHPELKRYTWRKKNPVKQARLDYFLTSNYLSPFIHNIKFENSYRSDHSPVVLYCRLTELKKGRGFWKFNNSLLTDIDYVQLIKQKINTIK